MLFNWLIITYAIIIWHCDFMKILAKAAGAKTKSPIFKLYSNHGITLLISFYTVNYLVTLKYAFGFFHDLISLQYN